MSNESTLISENHATITSQYNAESIHLNTLAHEYELLAEKYTELQKKADAQNDLFINLVHEFRTPLTVILSAAQLMELKKDSTTDEYEYFNKKFNLIRYNCFRLLRLTNNLLDISQAESGNMRFNPVNCNVPVFIKEIIQSITPYLEQKGLCLTTDFRQDNVVTAVDMSKFESIIINLLSNAIKFTEPGGHIYVTFDKQDDTIELTVRDTGSGIPSDKLDVIFHRFAQAGTNNCSRQAGSGIGLSLAKTFVEMHGGKINVTSELGMGSEFIIRLPITTL